MGKTAKERRKYKRTQLTCPARLLDGEGNVLAKSTTSNLSDGGAFLAVPIDHLPRRGSRLTIGLSVPRSTANTYMLEEFSSPARVVRHEPMQDDTLAGVGVRFDGPIQLQLEV